MLLRAWGIMGLVSAALTTGTFLLVLIRSGWTPGAATLPRRPLHRAYLQATTASFAAIVACQIGTALRLPNPASLTAPGRPDQQPSAPGRNRLRTALRRHRHLRPTDAGGVRDRGTSRGRGSSAASDAAAGRGLIRPAARPSSSLAAESLEALQRLTPASRPGSATAGARVRAVRLVEWLAGLRRSRRPD
jgi:hypothetical protein